MDNILVTGSDGLFGTALRRISDSYPYNFIFATHKDGDLTLEDNVKRLYESHHPAYVIHAAARVGGIGANLAMPAKFFTENILMNTYMLHYAWKYEVKKCIAFSSICSFADNLPVLKECLQQEGAPFRDNLSYGYSKRMVDIQIQAYHKQYGCNFCALIPANLYGISDNFNLSNGHVIASVIHKCLLAKLNNTELVLWGDGSSLREFIFADDMARISMSLLLNPDYVQSVLVSNPIEHSIKEVVQIICEKMNFTGNVVWDTSKPNGQFRRPSDTSLFQSLVPNFKFTPLSDGIQKTVDWFVEKYPSNVRL